MEDDDEDDYGSYSDSSMYNNQSKKEDSKDPKSNLV